ncbi:MAG: ParA family protein [Synergistaceae bacterium]|nr:ParA family protein [Synergistaceae bacterium]
MAIKVAIFNRKGGVGKTTLSIILTQIALKEGKKVIAIDQDTQCNFSSSMSYLRNDPNFKKLFTLKTDLREEYFDLPADWIIIDCQNDFNDRIRFALRHSDFILIPVTPDKNSVSQFTNIRQAAGTSKEAFQLPVVKIGFMVGNVYNKTQTAQVINQKLRQLRKSGYLVIGTLPLYETIRHNLASEKTIWWSTGLPAHARQHFELLYKNIEILNRDIQELRRKEREWKNEPPEDYYGDPENPDITIWGRNNLS